MIDVRTVFHGTSSGLTSAMEEMCLVPTLPPRLCTSLALSTDIP